MTTEPKPLAPVDVLAIAAPILEQRPEGPYKTEQEALGILADRHAVETVVIKQGDETETWRVSRWQADIPSGSGYSRVGVKLGQKQLLSGKYEDKDGPTDIHLLLIGKDGSLVFSNPHATYHPRLGLRTWRQEIGEIRDDADFSSDENKVIERAVSEIYQMTLIQRKERRHKRVRGLFKGAFACALIGGVSFGVYEGYRYYLRHETDQAAAAEAAEKARIKHAAEIAAQDASWVTGQRRLPGVPTNDRSPILASPIYPLPGTVPTLQYVLQEDGSLTLPQNAPENLVIGNAPRKIEISSDGCHDLQLPEGALSPSSKLLAVKESPADKQNTDVVVVTPKAAERVLSFCVLHTDKEQPQQTATVQFQILPNTNQ